MNWPLLIQVLGGLGIFIYGMKLLSESLQRVAGDRLRSFLSSMTRNRVSAVFSGLFITSTIQSSSATTVLVVGFVNAGLISLAQAIGVIMGANIGTTITAWIVSFLGIQIQHCFVCLTSHRSWGHPPFLTKRKSIWLGKFPHRIWIFVFGIGLSQNLRT